MPLSFNSRSHGAVAFGFFNIEADMLLLERLFFFADAFCGAAVTLASSSRASLEGWLLEPAQVGHLHGAIAGVDHSGFIGATYEKWPFPARQEDFKQSPEGAAQQGAVRELVAPYGRPIEIALHWQQPAAAVTINEILFDLPDFAALVGYVIQGGYPRWRDERRPPYVQAMMDALAREGSPLLPVAPRNR